MSRRRSSPILVGRDDELRLLEEAVADRAVRPVILLGGEAGIGKSRLVTELTARAEESGAIAVVGSCLELGADDLPYAPFVDALGRLMEALGDRAGAVVGASSAELAMLVPDLVTTDATQAAVSRGRMYEAVRSLLDRMPAPLVMVLEDVH